MDIKVDGIINKIAADQVGDESLSALDSAVDKTIISLRTIHDMLPTINAETPQEEEAKAKMIDIMETALMPYMIDFMDALQSFEGEEE